MKKRRFSSNKNQDLWITSYADLISAIFAVMILFVSFSKIDIEKYDMVQRLMIEKKKQEFDEFKTLAQIEKTINEITEEHKLEKYINIKMDNKGLIISFDSAAQFKSASYTLIKDKILLMRPILSEIVLQSQYRYIDIEGHTDNVPGTKVSNWELSALRALAIQKYLQKLGLNNKNVRLIANAENKPLENYKSTINSSIDKKARELNRRVSIIIGEAKFKDLDENKRGTKK
ncbi:MULTISPECIES: OmpA/MotB family protein [Arcobacteraceae]|nr:MULTISPECIES: OmpA family protein [Arcobacteraceae]OCL81781.1 Chemotaxis protein LafU [Arcobacter porcinus]OCL85429.1 Chemotaxis protein LafU [Arcobacter porcinus]OCL85489.1 Chemotaxis protein LafU [Aliarcobacter thereius]OCL90428.1 Chemotaxis protein LafU [Aliarcobacter thereius]OCL90634.1 Chemotaxis protein LafU [Aliarcobacter thereius]